MHFISWDGWLYIGPGRIRFQREVKVFRTYASCRIFVYTLVALVEIKTALCRTSILSMNWLSLSVDVSLTYNFCVLASWLKNAVYKRWYPLCRSNATLGNLSFSMAAPKIGTHFRHIFKKPQLLTFQVSVKTIILN